MTDIESRIQKLVAQGCPLKFAKQLAQTEKELELERAAKEQVAHDARVQENKLAMEKVQRAMDETAEWKAKFVSLQSAIATLAPMYADLLLTMPLACLDKNALVWLAERNALVANGGMPCKACLAVRVQDHM